MSNLLGDFTYFYFVFFNRECARRITRELKLPKDTESPSDEDLARIRREVAEEAAEMMFMGSCQEVGNPYGHYSYDLWS